MNIQATILQIELIILMHGKIRLAGEGYMKSNHVLLNET